VDTQASSFYGHMMLGLRIHFLYFSQPLFPKYVLLSICAFIRVYFWVFGKTFIAFILQVYTHLFQKLVMINEFFQRKVGSYLFSQACCFLARQLFIFIIFFFSSFFFFSYLLSFPFLLLFFFPFFKLFIIYSFFPFFSFSL